MGYWCFGYGFYRWYGLVEIHTTAVAMWRSYYNKPFSFRRIGHFLLTKFSESGCRVADCYNGHRWLGVSVAQERRPKKWTMWQAQLLVECPKKKHHYNEDMFFLFKWNGTMIRCVLCAYLDWPQSLRRYAITPGGSHGSISTIPAAPACIIASYTSCVLQRVSV